VHPTYFDTASDFRDWLEAHHASAIELIVGFRKVSSGAPSMTWPESVDEALCFGWIDGVRKRIDERAYQIRFTPRKKDSIWSLVNVDKVRALSEQGRMRPAGLAAFAARRADRTGVYAFEREQDAELAPMEVEQFRQNTTAWSYFESVAPGYRRVITHWVVSARQPATRARRFQQLLQACAEQRRILR
jgi:uncharacterized protein YdeI (YjbR/CyaY-like superfamily)